MIGGRAGLPPVLRPALPQVPVRRAAVARAASLGGDGNGEVPKGKDQEAERAARRRCRALLVPGPDLGSAGRTAMRSSLLEHCC